MQHWVHFLPLLCFVLHNLALIEPYHRLSACGERCDNIVIEYTISVLQWEHLIHKTFSPMEHAHTCFSQGLCGHIDLGYPTKTGWFWSGKKWVIHGREQLWVVYFRHYLAVNLMRKCWCILSYLGYHWQVQETSFLVHNNPITLNFSNS